MEVRFGFAEGFLDPFFLRDVVVDLNPSTGRPLDFFAESVTGDGDPVPSSWCGRAFPASGRREADSWISSSGIGNFVFKGYKCGLSSISCFVHPYIVPHPGSNT